MVALRFPGHPLHSCLKRVVGLTGKTVEMRNGSKRLRYGENACRQTALHADGRAGVGSATHLRGKVSSHNSLADLDVSWHLSLEFDRPAAATVRHSIPCGLGEGTIPAMGRLHSGNPVRRQYTRHPPALSSWVPPTTSPRRNPSDSDCPLSSGCHSPNCKNVAETLCFAAHRSRSWCRRSSAGSPLVGAFGGEGGCRPSTELCEVATRPLFTPLSSELPDPKRTVAISFSDPAVTPAPRSGAAQAPGSDRSPALASQEAAAWRDVTIRSEACTGSPGTVGSPGLQHELRPRDAFSQQRLRSGETRQYAMTDVRGRLRRPQASQTAAQSGRAFLRSEPCGLEAGAHRPLYNSGS